MLRRSPKVNLHYFAMASKLVFRSIILGAPGSGKGTISKRIINDFAMAHLASGDLLRSQISQKTSTGLMAEGYIRDGKLVPDQIMTDLISTELSAVNSNWLLDGFPRTLAQAEALVKRQEINVVLNLDVPFATIRERLEKRWTHVPSGRVYHLEWNPPRVPFKDDETGEDLVQREDDTPATVQKRLETYQEQTEPVIGFFRNVGILESFHGTESNVIYPKIKDHLLKMISVDN